MTDLPIEGAGPEQRAAYLETEVTVGGLSAADALAEMGSFWVVTAWNPFSEELSSAVNAGRHAELCQRLGNDGLTWLPAAGCRLVAGRRVGGGIGGRGRHRPRGGPFAGPRVRPERRVRGGRWNAQGARLL